MTTQTYFVLTGAQKIEAIALNSEEFRIAPRAIDSATPGSGLNLNELATGFGVGDPITLVGNYVAPYRIVNDPDYQQFVPDMITYLLTLPMALLENETIFLPPPEE